MTILVPESRELDLFVSMLEAEGAAALRCPLVRILPLHDVRDASRWIDRCIKGEFDDLILLTGEGLRHLLAICGARKDDFIGALGNLRIIVRGPKPTRALREIGLNPNLVAPVPTSQGVLEAFGMENLAGRRIAAQLYPGPGAERMVSALKAREAHVAEITPYRYAAESETSVVANVIRALAAGQVNMIVFTASLQIERLMWAAKESGLEAVLKDGLSRTAIASVGPVVQDALRKYQLDSTVQPEGSYHMKPLVRAIVKWRARSLAYP
jgi:uroporphyrinogen-III synthase